MTIKYTPDEWAALSERQQLGRLDLAPDGERERIEKEATQTLEIIRQRYPQLTKPEPDPLLKAYEKADQAIEFYRKAWTEDLCAHQVAALYEQLAFTGLDILALLDRLLGSARNEKRSAAQSKRSVWPEAILDLYSDTGSEFPTKELFCENFAEQIVETHDGRTAKAPKAETIRKFLTDEVIADYLDKKDLERRRAGNSAQMPTDK